MNKPVDCTLVLKVGFLNRAHLLKIAACSEVGSILLHLSEFYLIISVPFQLLTSYLPKDFKRGCT